MEDIKPKPELIWNESNIKIEELDIKPELVKCDHCNLDFTSLEDLIDHELTHSDIDKSEGFVTASEKTKKRVRKGGQLLQCKYCEKPFTYESMMKQHERVHTGEKPFSCNTCGKSFSATNDLRRHERRHTDQQRYECNICKKQLKSLIGFRRHGLLHEGIRHNPKGNQLQCKYCEKAFPFPSMLKNHERNHTGEKPYFCKFCEKSFNCPSNLRCHERLHIKTDRPFKCNKCKWSFKILKGLQQHERKMHPNVET